MPRQPVSLDAAVIAAAAQVVKRIVPAIQRQVAAAVASRLEAELSRGMKAKRGLVKPRLPSKKAELTKWVADRRARRVPKFVIKETGLDTKKKVIARYGADAVFEKGKPLPKAK